MVPISAVRTGGVLNSKNMARIEIHRSPISDGTREICNDMKNNQNLKIYNGQGVQMVEVEAFPVPVMSLPVSHVGTAILNFFYKSHDVITFHSGFDLVFEL